MPDLQNIVGKSIRASFANFLLIFGVQLTRVGLGHVEIDCPV